MPNQHIREASPVALGQGPEANSSTPEPIVLRRDAEFFYCLDSAVELGEISPLEAMLYSFDTPASQCLARRHQRDPNFWDSGWLRQIARSTLDKMGEEVRFVYALRAVPCLEMAIRALHERMEFVVQNKALKDLGMREELSRLLAHTDPGLVRAIPPKVFSGPQDVNRTTVKAFTEPLFAGIVARLDADVMLARDAVQWLALPGNQARARKLAAQLFAEEARGVLPEASLSLRYIDGKAISATHRKAVKSAKGAIKKAVKLLTRFGAAENARLLVSGKEVVISHPDSPFVFRLEAHHSQGWLLDRTARPGGHVPYKLDLESKDGLKLASLCVLFQNTPVLDQLLALSMYVQTGNEMELLQKANWFGTSQPHQARAYLAANAPSLVDKVYVPGEGRSVAGGRMEDWFRRISPGEEFWEPYKNPVSSWVGEMLLPARELLGRVQLSVAAQPGAMRAIV